MHLQVITVLLIAPLVLSASCPDGFHYEDFFSKCYKYVATPSSWLSAEEQCLSFGGHLVSIHSVAENGYVLSLTPDSKKSSLWIGFSLLKTAKFSWSAEEPVDYTSWIPGQPQIPSYYQCTQLVGSDHSWRQHLCSGNETFVCQAPPDLPAAQPCGVCPSLLPVTVPTCPPVTESPTCPPAPPCPTLSPAPVQTFPTIAPAPTCPPVKECPTLPPVTVQTCPPVPPSPTCPPVKECPTESPSPLKTPGTSTAPVTQGTPLPGGVCDDNLSCLDGYFMYSGNCRCYQYNSSVQFYHNAVESCKTHQATLVKIDSAGLNSFLAHMTMSDSRTPYIGLTCTGTQLQQCSWPDGTTLADTRYSNWYQGNPVPNLNTATVMWNVENTLQGGWQSIDFNAGLSSTFCEKAPVNIKVMAAAAKKKQKQLQSARKSDRKH